MLSYTISRNCKRDIPRSHWSAFLERLTDEQQNRQITLQISEEGQEDTEILSLETLRQTLFRSIVYESLAEGDYVTITVAEKQGRFSTSYDYVVEKPKRIEVLYEQGDQIFAVAIIDEANIRTAIHFEDDAVMLYRKPQILLSPLLETAMSSDRMLRSQRSDDRQWSVLVGQH